MHLFLVGNGLYEIFSRLSYFHVEHGNLVVIITWECDTLILLYDAPYMFSIGPIDMCVQTKELSAPRILEISKIETPGSMLHHNNHLVGTETLERVSLQPESQYTDYETATQQTNASKYIILYHNHKFFGPPTALSLRLLGSVDFATKLHPQSFKFCHLI